MGIRQATKSLASRGHPLSDNMFQLDVLNNGSGPKYESTPFKTTLKLNGYDRIEPASIEILQINVGKKCNQSCAHCHVDAGPDRREEISRDILIKCLELVDKLNITTVDITGGAPELHPDFKWFVSECSARQLHIIDRCNLTIIVSNHKYNELPHFFATHNVHLICSLPHFNKLRTDQQRGDGVFEDSIRALKMLNDVGYGKSDATLILDLVHNPSGAFLPGDQSSLEKEFKQQLRRKYNIEFSSLYSITNLPISRFLDYLIESGNETQYMEALMNAFNPATIKHLMCRNTLSVSYDGYLYDCDFNQMLDLKIATADNHISTFNVDTFYKRNIVVNQHCYGCTAGAGSSCGGQTIESEKVR